MKTFELTGTKREDLGTKYAKLVRKEGKVPCIVYGNGKQINFTVDGEPFNGHVGKIAAAQTWGTDSHFTYTITIDPATIEFDVASIAGFNNTTAGAVTVQ